MCMCVHRDKIKKFNLFSLYFLFSVGLWAHEGDWGGHRHMGKNKERGDKTPVFCQWCDAPRGKVNLAWEMWGNDWVFNLIHLGSIKTKECTLYSITRYCMIG